MTPTLLDTHAPKFANLFDLARLPYFDVKDGRLVLADPSLGPVVDSHTHLGLSYVRRPTLDLRRESPTTELYLRADKPIDFGVYMNRNFDKHDLEAVERDMTAGVLGPAGLRATHTLPNLLRDMEALGVRQSVLLPIDFPFLSENSETWLELTRASDKIICFGSVHPLQPRMREHFDKLVAMGARGLKYHPAVQMVGPDHDRAMKLFRMAGERQLPVLFHCGPVDIETKLGRRLSQVKRYERALAENPDTTFVLGHSGALQMEEAIVFASKYPNVYYEIASQSLPAVRRLLDVLPPGRLMVGSDWPFYHLAMPIAKVLLATEHDEKARRAVLYDNAAALFGLPARA
jgi:predicted TIM-barrel fold metal-dependent hydrolase